MRGGGCGKLEVVDVAGLALDEAEASTVGHELRRAVTGSGLCADFQRGRDRAALSGQNNQLRAHSASRWADCDGVDLYSAIAGEADGVAGP